MPELLRKNVKRTPLILQMEAVECGAAALAIILVVLLVKPSGLFGREEVKRV